MNQQIIPRELEIAVMQSWLDYMKAQHAKDEELLNHLQHTREEYKKELYEFLGPKSKEYETFYEKRREAVKSKRSQFTKTNEGLKNESEFRKKRLAEIDEFIRNLGIDVNVLRLIRKKYNEKFRAPIEKSEELTNSQGEGQ